MERAAGGPTARESLLPLTPFHSDSRATGYEESDGREEGGESGRSEVRGERSLKRAGGTERVSRLPSPHYTRLVSSTHFSPNLAASLLAYRERIKR